MWVRGLGFILLLMASSGCLRIVEKKPPGPWHEAYQPIDDPESHAFVAAGLELAISQFGPPVVPVNQILLRRSTKAESALRYNIAEDFSRTVCVDKTNGVFVIYMGGDPGTRNYYAVLGHECAHLINPRIKDWYMEGVATVFSQQICEVTGKEWGDWERHYTRSRFEPYALSYRMMLELSETFPEEYPDLIRFTAETEKHPGWYHIDIDGWLGRLGDAEYQIALDIIDPYVNRLRKQVSSEYEFTVPEALK